jgi:type I restriction enzyme S subunit
MSLGSNSILLKNERIKDVNTDFIYYFFVSQYGQNLISSITDGSVQPKFNKTNFRNLKIPLPPLVEQKTIVEVLTSLDEKIENLTKQNLVLESLIQTFFKSINPNPLMKKESEKS